MIKAWETREQKTAFDVRYFCEIEQSEQSLFYTLLHRIQRRYENMQYTRSFIVHANYYRLIYRTETAEVHFLNPNQPFYGPYIFSIGETNTLLIIIFIFTMNGNNCLANAKKPCGCSVLQCAYTSEKFTVQMSHGPHYGRIVVFHYLLRLRRRKRKSVEVGVFRRMWVTLRLNFRLNGYFLRQYLWTVR